MDVCQHCHAPLAFRRDASGILVLEMCRACHPSAYVQEPAEVFPWLPKFVAFTGLAQSGKTTCAKWLVDKFGFGLLSFAAPLKRMLATLVTVHDKEATPDVLCGKTVRHAMQTLGTEWGRQLIGPDIWIRAAQAEYERVRLAGVPGVTCDDVRFDNEAELVQKLGGIVIELERPGQARMAHVSERGVRPDLINATISAEDPASLVEQLDEYLSRA